MFLMIWKKQIMPWVLSYFLCYEVPSVYSSVPPNWVFPGRRLGRTTVFEVSLLALYIHIFPLGLSASSSFNYSNHSGIKTTRTTSLKNIFTQGFIRTFPWMYIFQAYCLMPPVPWSASPFSCLFLLFCRQFHICFHIINSENDLKF